MLHPFFFFDEENGILNLTIMLVMRTVEKYYRMVSLTIIAVYLNLNTYVKCIKKVKFLFLLKSFHFSNWHE